MLDLAILIEYRVSGQAEGREKRGLHNSIRRKVQKWWYEPYSMLTHIIMQPNKSKNKKRMYQAAEL